MPRFTPQDAARIRAAVRAHERRGFEPAAKPKPGPALIRPYLIAQLLQDAYACFSASPGAARFSARLARWDQDAETLGPATEEKRFNVYTTTGVGYYPKHHFVLCGFVDSRWHIIEPGFTFAYGTWREGPPAFLECQNIQARDESGAVTGPYELSGIETPFGTPTPDATVGATFTGYSGTQWIATHERCQ